MGEPRPIGVAPAGQGAGAGDAPPASSPVLSFVIPAFNEEDLIGRTIDGIRRFAPASFEIIVVDNGSTDATTRVAADLGATVIRRPDGTIGSLRNAGVREASGGILVFLDADVVPTPDWARHLPGSIERLKDDPDLLTGSLCSVPADASWLERWWFSPRTGSSHLGTGHMIMTRRFFDELGGFDERLTTGEDYDLSRRALDRGGRIALEPRLKVEHYGFPRTVRAFLQREAWHGVGDFRSVAAFLGSKVAMAAALFAGLHVALVGALLAGAGAPALAAGAGIIGLCAASSWRKYRGQPARVVGVNAGVYWLYYLGRTLAMARSMTGTYSRRSRAR